METQPNHYKVTPSPKTQAAVHAGVRRYGLTAFVKKSGVSWTVLCGTGFGLPVSRASLETLETTLKNLNLY